MKKFSKNKSSIFHFKLFNEDGNGMVLNGVSISFTIIIFTYTPFDSFFKKIRDFIDYLMFKEINN